MTEQNRLIECRFPAQADRLKLLRRVVYDAAEMAGSGAEMAEKAVIAVNEACMNIIQHAYNNDPDGEIILEIINNDNTLVFQLTDFADPADINTIKPRALDDVKPGGLGTHFMNEVMDSVEYSVNEECQGNRVTMTMMLKK